MGGVGGAEGSPTRWEELPHCLGMLLCHYLSPMDVVALIAASWRKRELATSEEVWRYFCSSNWGSSANFAAYQSSRELYLDGNGWFPHRHGQRQRPFFETRNLKLHDSPCLTMDMRFSENEIVAVSEARMGRSQACIHIIDPETCQLRQQVEVSSATINCCDVGPGLICVGSDDSKVRVYRRCDTSIEEASGFACAPAQCSTCAEDEFGGVLDFQYQFASEFTCSSEVNDLRFAREGAVIAVRTHHNRNPAGLDVIPLSRPGACSTFPGGGWATRGKFIHALDGFEDGCSLGKVACSGEHPLTSAFSAMLFDFRRPAPCVSDFSMPSTRLGHPANTMLWPLRAGSKSQVYANLLFRGGPKKSGGTIAMVDFRFPSTEVCARFELPHAVEDFRCFDGNIYAVCGPPPRENSPRQLSVYRCSAGACKGQNDDVECLSTVQEVCNTNDPADPVKEDLKVFSVCSRGFAISHGGCLTLNSLACPPWRGRGFI